MMTLVTGRSNSGKSEFAENLVLKDGFSRRYYIATMLVMDEEAATRRERHRKSRRGKGFETLEIPCLIDAAPSLMADPKNCSVLLECVANLVGNIMHSDEWEKRIKNASAETVDDLSDNIVRLITDLASSVGNLTVVSLVCDDESDKTGDEETKLYLFILDNVNRRLSRIADKVYNL